MGQKVHLTADVAVLCLGRQETRDAFKYMVRIENVDPVIVQVSESQDSPSKEIRPPAFETRQLKRGAAGEWFKGAWETVKTWFQNLFTGKSKIRVPHPEDFVGSGSERECKTRASPEDLEREGEFMRSKRQAGKRHSKYQYDEMFATPFEFVQTADGKVLEILFAEKETDETVKNFKKHLADAFATKVRPTSEKMHENSPIGEHLTKYEYLLDNGADGKRKVLFSMLHSYEN